jgi:hypothetical protein
MRAAYRGTQAETIASSVPNVLQIVNELAGYGSKGHII